MLTMLKDYPGKLEINGKSFNNIQEAIKLFHSDSDNICINLHAVKTSEGRAIPKILPRKITVKQYMTRKSTDDFDFMRQWNNDIPMPLRTMVGTVEKETPGMVYMKLHGDITEEKTMFCLKCGRQITNPVSQYFGMGPECGCHNYINPFFSEEELKQAVGEYRKKLQTMTWEGWIIKSAIIQEEDVNVKN